MRGVLAAMTVLLLALTMPESAGAQMVGGGGLLQSYRFDDPQAAGLTSFRLTTLPFAAGISLGRLGVELSGAMAEGEATGPEGATATLSGPTDTYAALSFAVVPDRVVFRVVGLLPTGQSTQSLAESAVAGVVAAELIPFAISSWGTGGSVGADVALAFQAGDVGVGLSGGYEAAQEFEPLAEEAFAYRPGDRLRLRLAVDGDVGESGTLSLLVGVQRFTEDQLASTNLFRSGNRVEAVASYAFALGLRGSALLYGGVFHREKGALLLEVPSLEGATESPSQQLFTGGANLSLPLTPRVTLLPDADMRVFRTADGVGQGWLASAGATLDMRVGGRRFGRRVVLAPTARYRVGNVLVREGAEYGFTGWEAGMTLRVETGR